MLRSGIHKVPTMVSQMRPLFHTSTVRPRSRRFISLKRGNNRLMLWGGGAGEMQQNTETIQKERGRNTDTSQSRRDSEEFNLESSV